MCEAADDPTSVRKDTGDGSSPICDFRFIGGLLDVGMMIRMTRSFAAFALAGSVLAAPASAQMTAEIVEATLLEGWRTEDGSHMTALSLTLAPGWKTYWRAPGDAGIPPYFDWSGSENLGAGRLHWAVPEVYFINGMRSIGYETAVMIPMEIEPKAATEPIRIASDVTLGVCEEICIPVTREGPNGKL